MHIMGILRKVSLLGFFLAFACFAQGQTTLSKADKQYELKAFNLAVKSYLKVLEKQPNNPDALSRLADCYFHLNRMDEALIYYERAIQTGQIDPMTHFYYGQALKAVGQYTLAKNQFLQYARVYAVEGNLFVESCDFALSRINEPAKYEVRNEYLNTTASDFGPALYRNYVVYSSARIDLKRAGEAPQHWTGNASNQLLITSRDNNDYLRNPDFLHSELRESYNEGPISYSPDGKWVAITKNNFVDGTRQIPSSGMELSLYIAEVDNMGDWINALPFPHNGVGFSNGYPCFSPDGQALYFASDRPDGYGGYDIYISYRIGNTWSTPENLGPVVNTIGNEISPYYDGETLYLASDWHKGFGGYDIFKAERMGARWSSVEHLGTDVNSPRDDYGFVYDQLANIGYFVSNRVGGKGMEDVYRIRKVTESITVQVVSATDRAPIDGAVIDLASCGIGQFMTDASGSYKIQAKQGLSCRGTVSKSGYLPSEINVTSTGLQSNRSVTVMLRKQGEEYLGQIVNATNGYPVAGVNVRATSQASGMTMEAYSDENGRYSLALSPYTSYILKFSAPGFLDVSRVVSTTDGRDKSVLGSITLPPSTSVAAAGSSIVPKQPGTLESYGAESGVIMPAGYSVQVAAISTERPFDLSEFEGKLSDVGNVYSTEEDGRNKVRVGPYNSRDEANEVLKKVKAKGYKGAFVVKQEGASPSNSGLTPKGMPTNYGAESTRFDFATTNYFQSNAASADNYLIKLASYTDTKWFQETKVADLGTLEKRQKGKYTIMLLKGYTSKDQALQALAKAKDRGFSGAYLVTQDSTGELSRVN